MDKEIRTWGFARKSQLPNNVGGTPKICWKCELWFLAGWKQRTCDSCLPGKYRAMRAAGLDTHGRPNKSALSLVSRVENVASTIHIERGPSFYSYKDRKQAVSLALKLAKRSAVNTELNAYTEALLTYAVSTSKRVVPGSTWQFVCLGHRIQPCNGELAPDLLPRTDGVETLEEVAA